jgi:hypothetical protein
MAGKAILRGKGDSGLSYSGIDEILVSHLKETEKMQESQFDLTKPSYKSLSRLKGLSGEN